MILHTLSNYGGVFQKSTKKSANQKARSSPRYDFEFDLRKLQSADPTLGKAAVYLINNTDNDQFINYAEIGMVI